MIHAGIGWTKWGLPMERDLVHLTERVLVALLFEKPKWASQRIDLPETDI